MPKTKTLQTNFGAGEIEPEAALRRDTKQYAAGAKSLLNGQPLIAGGNRRRPGSLEYARKSAEFRCVEFDYGGDEHYVLAFGAGTMDAYLLDGTPAGSITDGTWTDTIWQTMDWLQEGNVVFLTDAAMMRQVTRVTANTWTHAAIDWRQNAAGRIKQPHYKIAPDDVTITPSALSGSITLELSENWWTADHVGARIRILDREIEITAVTDGNTATGTVKEALRPYQSLTVTSSVGFAVDEVVEGQTSGARGIVCSIPDATHVVAVISENLTKFTAEGLIGPNITTTISAVVDASPAAVGDWTEQAFSAQNGFPLCVELHRKRLLFGGAAGVPNGLAGSSLNDLYDFDVGDGSDGDGFFEPVGDGQAKKIVQLHSSEQLLVLTDRGPYYVPESDSVPFRPSSLAFNHFGGTWETSEVRSADYDGGVIWCSGSTIIKATPTGDLRRAWAAQEVSFLVGHLLSGMVDSCFVDNFGGGDERFGLFVNDDGTAALMMLVAAEEIRQFMPWDTAGAFKSFCALNHKVFACVERVIDGATVYTLEAFDHDITLDCATVDADVDTAAAGFGATECHIVTQGTNLYLGAYPLTLTTVPAGPYVAGLFYDREIETLPPEVEDGEGSRAGELKRISEAWINTLESYRFEANGTRLQAYQIGEDLTQPPPARTGWQYFTFLGWEADPTIAITQPDPLPLTVLGIKATVVY